MTKLTVVNSAPYPVALPNGRHLSPGEIALVPDSEELRSLQKLGLLRVVLNVSEEEKKPAEDKTPTRTIKHSPPSSSKES